MIVTPGQLNPYHLDLSALKILVIDDFADMRSMMRRTVESFKGLAVELARDGDEALEKMGATKFDLVLCDYNLGDGKDGQQILEEAKHRKYISSTTIWMMVTAETTVEMVMGALEYKPDDYLTKPFTKQEFAVRVMKIQARKAELRDILAARDSGAYDKALEHVAAHLAKKETFELLQIKADLHERQQAWSEADAIYNRVLGQRPLAWAQLGHARMLIRAEKFDAAKDILSAAIAQMPTLVEAYDLLAGVHETLGDAKSAQQVLESAIAQSPKAILRQKAMARLAYANTDLDAAEKAYRRIIKMGRGSIYKSADDYSGLARVYADKGAATEAVKVLSTLKEEFKHNHDALLQGLLAEADIYTKLGLGAQAEQALDGATAIAQKAANISSGVAMDFIKAALNSQRDALAQELTTTLVKNNHDDAELVLRVQASFDAAGKGDTAKKLVDAARQATRELLDKGTELVKQGALDEAISHFLQAAGATPNNLQVNLALAQTLVKAMQKNGKTERHVFLLRQSLDKVRQIDPSNGLLPTLQELYRQLVGAQTAPA